MAPPLSESMRERIVSALQLGMITGTMARIRNTMQVSNDVTRKNSPGRPAHVVTKLEALKLRNSEEKTHKKCL